MKLRELFENTKLTKNVKISESGIKDGRFSSSFTGIDLTGDFSCYNRTSLKSLEGAPTSITGDFSCRDCTSLTSLEGAPIVRIVLV